MDIPGYAEVVVEDVNFNIFLTYYLIIMKFELTIPEYIEGDSFKTEWVKGFEIYTELLNDSIVISANREGLITLATQLLTLAQDSVPDGYHFHLTDLGGLNEGSIELIFNKEQYPRGSLIK